MNSNNVERIMVKSNTHIFNINRLLKEVKSNVLANFICFDNKDIVIMTNKIAAFSNLNIMEKYVNKVNNINASNIMSLRLSQSKSYLKILGISYFVENTNLLITPDIVESVIKSTHIFNDIVLASWPWVIKASPKSNMVVIWIDIWDSQSSMNAKCLINRSFNIGYHITTIREMNMNLSIPQCKNCWNGAILHSYIVHMKQNIRNITVHTNWNIIEK